MTFIQEQDIKTASEYRAIALLYMKAARETPVPKELQWRAQHVNRARQYWRSYLDYRRLAGEAA